MTDWVEQHYQEQRTKKKGGPGSGHWGHSGRPGKRGGSLPGTGGATSEAGAPVSAGGVNHVPREDGRQDRRVGRNAWEFESKVVKSLSRGDMQHVLWPGNLSKMTQGVRGYADEIGIGDGTARRWMTWARDAGLLEKVGNEYKKTPLGKFVDERPRTEWNDHLALMTGDQSMMYGARPKLDAVGYWLYANWPKDVSTVTRSKVSIAWTKTTGDKWGKFDSYIRQLEAEKAFSWGHIADLDTFYINGNMNREDWV